MFTSLTSYFTSILLDCTPAKSNKARTSSFIYRDELNKKPANKVSWLETKEEEEEDQEELGKAVYQTTCDESNKKPAKKVRWLETKEEEEEEDQEELGKAVLGCHDQGTGVIRVKVKMTKEEAARLMSKCKEGRFLEFRDVAHELVQLPVNRVRVVSSANGGFGGGLHSIAEEEN